MSVLNIICPRPTDIEGHEDRTEFGFLPQDYGSPRYGMSESSWLLIVAARCALEDVIRILRLDVPLYSPDETDDVKAEIAGSSHSQ